MNGHFNISKLGFCSFWAAMLLNVLLLSSCGEDRTYQYEEKTANSIWIYEQMKDYYFYSSMLKQQEEKDYFAKPDVFFAKLAAMGDKDKWSYIVVDTLRKDPRKRGYFDHLNSYGIDYVLMQDPTGATTREMVRILSVIKGSPADSAGLERNDFIEKFDEGYKFSSKNVDRLISGQSTKLQVMRLMTRLDSAVFEWGDLHEVNMKRSEYVEDKAISIFKSIPHKGINVGYVMANRLKETNDEVKNGKSDYKQDLDDAFLYLKNMKVSELVLDLRLCNDGSFEMARRMASYVVGDADLSKVFAKRVWNDFCAAKNDSLTFDQSLAGKTLGMKRVFVITSNYTQGAAEWVIMALKHALGNENVILVGTATAGQNMYTENVASLGGVIHIYPAVAKIMDGAGNTFESYKPDIELNEFGSPTLLPYGSEKEVLLGICLNSIKN